MLKGDAKYEFSLKFITIIHQTFCITSPAVNNTAEKVSREFVAEQAYMVLFSYIFSLLRTYLHVILFNYWGQNSIFNLSH